MAGYPWEFTLLPETINEITVTKTGTSDSVVLQRQSMSFMDSVFTTSHFVETNTVTISATGYQDVENVLVGTSSITMIPASSSKPEHLYGWQKYGKELSGNDLVYTASATPSVGDSVYTADGLLTKYTVRYIISSSTISIEDCIVIFKVVQKDLDVFDITINGITTHNPTVNTFLGANINYTIGKQGYMIKSGMITATSPYQIINIDLTESNKNYTISYDNSDYTASIIENTGLVITASTKTNIDLGADFTITEN